MNVQKVLIQVEDNLVPALESYLEAVSSLQAIFEQFHMECKGLKDNLQKTDDKMGQQVAEKQLQLLYNGLKKKGKKIGVACTSSVNLYNQLTSQFDALSKQNALEVPKNFEMAQDIKKLCDSEMKNMDNK